MTSDCDKLCNENEVKRTGEFWSHVSSIPVSALNKLFLFTHTHTRNLFPAVVSAQQLLQIYFYLFNHVSPIEI